MTKTLWLPKEYPNLVSARTCLLLSAIALCNLVHGAEVNIRVDQDKQLTTPELLSLFKPLEWKMDSPDGHSEVFRYLLFDPSIDLQDERLPLIVWLHGHGAYELGDPAGQLKYVQTCVFTDLSRPKRYRFFFLAPQCPANHGGWLDANSANGGSATSAVDALLAMIDQLLAKHPIDPGRISLVGLSSGASASWEVVRRYPNRFSAIVPISSGHPGSVEDVAPFMDVSVWTFNCQQDTGAAIEPIREMVSAINRAGGYAYASEIPSKSHHGWLPAFEHWPLLEWMLAQKRGEVSTVQFGGTPFALTSLGLAFNDLHEHAFGIIGFILLIVACGLCFWRISRSCHSAVAIEPDNKVQKSHEPSPTQPIVRLKVAAAVLIVLLVGFVTTYSLWQLSRPVITTFE